MNNYRIAILLIIIFIISLAGAYTIYKNQTNKNLIPIFEQSPSPEAMATISPSPSPSAKPVGSVPPELPSSGSDTAEVKNIGIQVQSPEASNIASSPIKVTGTANVFEGKIIATVKDGNGNILGSTNTTACMGYDACPFEATINFSTPTTQAGIVEVYSPSGLDNSPRYLQQILVRF